MKWRFDITARGLCFGAIGFLLCGSVLRVYRTPIDISPLAPAALNDDSVTPAVPSSAIYGPTSAPSIHGATLGFYGPRAGSENPATSAAHTPWYQAVPQFAILLAGYPNHAGNALALEVDTGNSQIIHLPLAQDQDSNETWRVREISLREIANPLKFRIVALCGTAAPQAWLSFSQPFLIRTAGSVEAAKELLLVILATTAAIVAFVFPGLILRHKLCASFNRHLGFIWIPVPGVLMLALIGLASWFGPHQVRARSISRLSLCFLILFITYQVVRAPLSKYLTAIERRVLVLFLLLAGLAVAKSIYSVGPAGELYGGRISRTLEVGGRSDSRVEYHIVQLVALRLGPFSPFARSLFFPWNFSHRGPIPGLAAAPLVLASPVQVTPNFPDQPWTVFDPEGFAAYRIAMIVMACSALLTVFGIARLFVPEEWAYLAFLVTLTAPFVIHEIYFTWPKLLAAGFVLLAAYLLFQSRFFLAGLSVGIGYLCHPSALVWIPALACFAVLCRPSFHAGVKSWPRRLSLWIPRALSFTASLAICLLAWWFINGKHFAQESFLTYFAAAGDQSHTTANWLRSRLDSLLNTLVPLILFFFHPVDIGVNSFWGLSPRPVQFGFAYWDTLPFGVGIVFFFCLIRLMYVAWQKARAWLLLIIVAPLIFFCAYMGVISSGMLRDGMHAWFLALMVFAVVIWNKFSLRSHRFWQICSWALLLRAVDILIMLLLPSVWSRHMLVQKQFALTDILALLTITAVTIYLCVHTFLFSERLRRSSALSANP